MADNLSNKNGDFDHFSAKNLDNAEYKIVPLPILILLY